MGNTTINEPAIHLKAGAVLYNAGDAADTIYKVESGVLKSIVGLMPIDKSAGYYIAGDYIGTDALICTEYHDKIIAVTRATLTPILEPRIAADAKLAYDVTTSMAEQIRRKQRLVLGPRLPAIVKLIVGLTHLAQLLGQPNGNGMTMIPLTLTVNDLKEITGDSSQQVRVSIRAISKRGAAIRVQGIYYINIEMMADLLEVEAERYVKKYNKANKIREYGRKLNSKMITI